MNATISLYCPRMRIVGDGIGKRKTYAEPMIATLVFDDGSKLVMQNVVIPPTVVKKLTMTHWLVDTCVGQGTDSLGNTLMINLPPQDVIFTLAAGLIAVELPATGTYKTKDDSIGQVSVTWPDCKVDLYDMTAEACVATGTVTF